MRVFITGATGWVGSLVARDLLAHGHTVLGLARSPEKGAVLAAEGAEILHGSITDLDLLQTSAAACDAVAHLGFNHDFSRFAESCAEDQQAIEALGRGLEGSNRPLLVTSGVASIAPGRVATEADTHAPDTPLPRRSEQAAAALRERGIRAATVRLPPTTHGVGDHGFMAILAAKARETGVSAYVGDGQNRWPATHRSDAARLYRLALEDGAAHPTYHPVAEEGIPFREIAAAIGRALGVPTEAREPAHFGFLGAFVGADMPASGAKSAEWLGWTATGPTLLADLADPAYFAG